MLGLLQLLALGFVLAVGLGTWLVVHRLRRPTRRTYAWAVARGVPGDPSEIDAPRAFESYEMLLDGVRCAVWDIAGDDPAGPVVVCSPGWGDAKLGVLPRLDALAACASRVVAWDSPGLGDTPGLCPMGTREPRMLLRLAREVRAGDQPVVLFGWSLGAGSSIAAGALEADADPSEPRAIAGVVAEAPYRHPWTPTFRVMRTARLPWRLNGPPAFALLGIRLLGSPTWRGFDRAAHAARARCPLLVLHGTADEICPCADGRAIASAAPAGTLVPVPGGGHNDLWTDETHRVFCRRAVQDFLGSIGGAATPG